MLNTIDLGLEKRTGAYVLHEEELTIIEKSASPSIPYLYMKQLRGWLSKFVAVGESIMKKYPNASLEEKIRVISNGLLEMVRNFLKERNVPHI